MSTLDNYEISVDLGRLQKLYTLQNLLYQIRTNIQLITQGAAGKMITVNGANLFVLAAQYYGDASLWTTIAKANGLVDPQVQAGTPITLVIPSQTDNTLGIYQP